jgi:hypothetical protein
MYLIIENAMCKVSTLNILDDVQGYTMILLVIYKMAFKLHTIISHSLEFFVIYTTKL